MGVAPDGRLKANRSIWCLLPEGRQSREIVEYRSPSPAGASTAFRSRSFIIGAIGANHQFRRFLTDTTYGL